MVLIAESVWRAAEELRAHDPCNNLHLIGPDELLLWRASIVVECDSGTVGEIFYAYGGTIEMAVRNVMHKWRYDNELRPEYFVYPQEGYR